MTPASAAFLAWLDAQPNGASMDDCMRHTGTKLCTMQSRMRILRAYGHVMLCSDPAHRNARRWYTPSVHEFYVLKSISN